MAHVYISSLELTSSVAVPFALRFVLGVKAMGPVCAKWSGFCSFLSSSRWYKSSSHRSSSSQPSSPHPSPPSLQGAPRTTLEETFIVEFAFELPHSFINSGYNLGPPKAAYDDGGRERRRLSAAKFALKIPRVGNRVRVKPRKCSR